MVPKHGRAVVLKREGRKKLALVPGKRALYAQVAELVDAADLESAGLSGSYGFESRLAHTLNFWHQGWWFQYPCSAQATIGRSVRKHNSGFVWGAPRQCRSRLNRREVRIPLRPPNIYYNTPAMSPEKWSAGRKTVWNQLSA
jgi:hypothetical protein